MAQDPNLIEVIPQNSTIDLVYYTFEIPTENVTDTPALSQPTGLTSTVLTTLLFVVTTGLIGCLANGSVLFALIADKSLLKCSATFLIKYQIGLDFASCVLLVVSYAMKVVLGGDPDTMKRWGTVVCMFFIGDGLTTLLMNIATANLVMIAVERYIKIVHPVKHRNYFKKWMLYVGVMLTILQGILINVPMTWTSVIDEYGTCNVYSLWSNSVSPQIYATFILAWLYITPLTVLGYFYGRIVVTLNRKRSVVAPEQSMSSATTQHTTQDDSMNRSQMNVIKTMILISVGYALSSFLSCFGYVSFAFNPSSVLYSEPVYYAGIALYYLNAWLDPFVYVFIHKNVRQTFVKYLTC